MSKRIKRLIKKLQKLGVETKVLSFSPFPLVRLSFKNRIEYIVGWRLPLIEVGNIKIVIDKNLTKKILKRAGMKTPKGFLASTYKEALIEMEKRNFSFPLVVKPNNQSMGSGVFADITTRKEFEKSITFLRKDKHIPFLVEEYFDGSDFRFLVLKGKVIAVAERIPPFVIGSGKETLRELIDDFNKNKKEKLKIDKEFLRNIEKQKISLNSVLKRGKKIQLRKNANIHTGGISKDITDETHQKFKNIAIKAAKEVALGFAGVDILAKDITRENSPYVLTEINCDMAWDLHEEVCIGKKRDIATQIIRAIKQEMGR